MNQRLTQLFDFLKDEPNDPFLLYAVATEYVKSDKQKAKEYFDKLLAEHPKYVATYYHAAALYIDFDELDSAKDIYEKGIKIAKEQQEALALRELQNAYNNLLFEMDDDW